MIKNIITAGVTALVVTLVAIGLVGGNQSAPSSLSGSTSDNWNVGGNLAVTGTSAFTGAPTFTADATFNGGDGGIVITTSNTATSSIEVGCWQSYATSTATALKLMFTASTTAPTNGSGVIPVVSYGTCP